MDKITSFQIKRLEVSGFKCFADPVSFDFGEITNILGSNHAGKSSIAAAITFAVTGATYWGESRIDRMYSEVSPSIEITLDFADQNGIGDQLIRRRKNDKMAITYKVTQSQLNSLFGNRGIGTPFSPSSTPSISSRLYRTRGKSCWNLFCRR